MKQFKPLAITGDLGDTLARRIQALRCLRHLSIGQLAALSRFSPRRLEEIEAGFETWLSYVDRQVLAKSLGIEPGLIEEVEKRSDDYDEQESRLREKTLVDAILAGARELDCPRCQRPLRASVQEGFDLDGNRIIFAKAFCSVCPFVLRDS